MTMRTTAKQVEGLGSAKSGTEHFWHQRMTAIANLPLIVFLVWFIVSHLGASRAAVVASVQNPWIAICLMLSFVAILWHMRLGLQIVIEDYVHGAAAKLACFLFNSFYVAALGMAVIFAILKMSLGG